MYQGVKVFEVVLNPESDVHSSLDIYRLVSINRLSAYIGLFVICILGISGLHF